MDMQKYRALFIEEGREHQAALSRLVVDVEQAAEPAALVDEVFRHVHSIKGMAASMGYDPISTLAHRVEDVVGAHRAENVRFAQPTIDCLLRAVDALGAQIDAIAAGEPLEPYVELVHELESHTKPQAAADQRAAPGRWRVDVSVAEASATPSVRAFLVYRRLGNLGTVSDCSPPIDAIKSGKVAVRDVSFVLEAATGETEIRRVLDGIADLERVTVVSDTSGGPETKAGAAPAGRAPGDERRRPSTPGGEEAKVVSTVRVRTDVLDGLIDTVGELFIARERLRIGLGGRVDDDSRAALDALGARIRDIHDQVMAVRMMPMRTLTDRYPRLVRDLARSLDKEIELDVTGGEIELDRGILDSLDAPLIHTLRNAVDHGIESPAQRTRLGKARAGRIQISALRDRDAVLVAVEDDGRGLDPVALAKLAVARGLLTRQVAQNLSAREAYFLICTPGFSTKPQVSDVSGRGVGMDIVRSKIESLGGSLDIESELGRRTRFVLRLPLTLAIIPVLLVEAAGRLFAVPAAKVVAVRETGEDVFEQVGGVGYLSFQHAMVRITPLVQMLRLASQQASGQVVVIEDGRELYALAVERIVGYREVVVKPLGDPLDRLEWFSGATILGDGQPILILDLPKALRPVAA